MLYGAPFDSTTSYRPGARFGPSAIRHESFGLETSSPYQNADLNELAPMLDISGVSTATACKVLRELLIALDKGWPGFQT